MERTYGTGPMRLLLLGVCLFLIVVPMITQDPYKLGILIRIFVFSTLALGVRIILLTGQLTLGHAAIWAVGGYSSALLAMKVGLPVWVSFLLSGPCAALVGLMLGFPTLRIKGIYFAIITLAFAELIHIIIVNQPKLLGGDMGIRGVPTFESVGGVVFHDFSPWAYYYLALLLGAIAFTVMWRVDHSRLGRLINAIREDDELTESLGVHLMRYKMTAFLIGCLFAGLAGGFWAHYYRFLHPSLFTVWESIFMLVYVVIGGVRSAAGPVLGAATLLVMSEIMRGALAWKAVIYAAVLIAVIFMLPHGLLGVPGAVSRIMGRRQAERRGG